MSVFAFVLVNVLVLSGFVSGSISPGGEDPYKILNISRDATPRDIDRTYRSLSFYRHPSLCKIKECRLLWAKASDAFDILSNPWRKMLFDEMGQLDWHNDTVIDRDTPLITQQMFSSLAKDGSELVLLVYRHLDGDQFRRWESFGKFLRDYVVVGRVDASREADLVVDLGMDKYKLPQLVFVEVKNGTSRVKRLGRGMKSVESAMTSVFQRLRPRIAQLRSSVDVDLWLEAFEGRVHVLQVVNEEATLDFKYSASKLRHKCVFATVRKDLWGTYQAPTVQVYRVRYAKPFTISTRRKRMFYDIDYYSPPVFPVLNRDNLLNHCHDWCIVPVSGHLDSTIVEAARLLPYNTAMIIPGSELARRLDAESEICFVFAGMRVWKTDPLNAVIGFNLFHHKLYSSASPTDVLPSRYDAEFSLDEFVSSECLLSRLWHSIPFRFIWDRLVVTHPWYVFPLLPSQIIMIVCLVLLIAGCISIAMLGWMVVVWIILWLCWPEPRYYRYENGGPMPGSDLRVCPISDGDMARSHALDPDPIDSAGDMAVLQTRSLDSDPMICVDDRELFLYGL